MAADRRVYLEQHGIAGVQRFHSQGGTRIYSMSVETFPRHINNIYLLIDAGSAILFDCGSGLDSSRRDLALGFAVVRDVFGETARYEDLDWCVVSHAHFDHFGGANVLKREIARAPGRPRARRARALVLRRAARHRVEGLRRLLAPRRRPRRRSARCCSRCTRPPRAPFAPQEVDRLLRDGDTIGPGYQVHHVPGHCPGLICLQVHDVLLTSDHVLARTTPHQFPQAITPFAGLEHYFHSLSKIRKLEGMNFALGGHEEPIWDLRARIDAIALFHRDRLARVKSMCASAAHGRAGRARHVRRAGGLLAHPGDRRGGGARRVPARSSASFGSRTSTRSPARATRSSSTWCVERSRSLCSGLLVVGERVELLVGQALAALRPRARGRTCG